MIDIKEYNFIQKNSFEKLNINLNFNDRESKPLVKIGTHIKKNELLAGGNNSPYIFAPFNSIITDIKKIRIAENNIVSTHIEIERENIESIKQSNVSTNIKTPLDFLIYIESKGVINCQDNCDIFENLYKYIKKMKSLVINFYDADEYTFTNKYLFESKITENVETLVYLSKLFHFEKINIIYDKSNVDAVSRYKSLISKHNALKVEFLEVEKPFDYKFKLKFKLKTLSINSRSFAKKHTLYFDAKTFFDIFVAVKRNQPITSTYFTLGGDAIENVGIYRMPIGVSIREIIEIAKTKNNYDFVDNYVYNAMEAHNDKISFEKEIEEEQDEAKKQELISLMEKKEQEAKNSIFDKMEDTLEYYNQCLGLVYEVKGHRQTGVYSQYNVITPSTSSLIMVTRNTLKKLK